MGSLQNRVVIVTGASRGIGRAVAVRFGEAGAAVVVAARGNHADAVAEEIRGEGGRAASVSVDVTDTKQIEAMVGKAIEEYGRIDVLVNNAGMSPLYPNLSAVTEELFDKVVGVNLKGPYRLSALIGERMAAGDGGAIINVSSNAAVQPTPNSEPYGACKAGINSLTLSLAHAFGPRVRVNCIQPGPFLTDISKAWDMDAFNKRAKTNIALQRGGEADEVVGAALYLAGPTGSYTTGAVIAIDGGSRV